MKRLILILSPYIIFWTFFIIPFILRPTKHKKSESDSTLVDTTIVDNPIIETDSSKIDSLINVEDNLNEVLEDKDQELIDLQNDAQYKLIVGSFKSELKAQELSDNLSKEGYIPRIIKNEPLLRVCVAFSNSEEEIAEVKSSLESKGYQPWVLKSTN